MNSKFEVIKEFIYSLQKKKDIRELEQALEESLMLNQKALEMKEIEDKMLNFSVKEYETVITRILLKILIFS